MIKIGLVGMPNAGKSTLFNTLTSQKIAIAAYPFTTIDPNHGTFEIDHDALCILKKVFMPEKIIMPAVEVVDIAGLIEGAYKGEGLGGRFLGTIREMDMILHVVRAFDSESVARVIDNAEEERNLILNELTMADYISLSNRESNSLVTEAMDELESGKQFLDNSKYKSLHLITTKPYLLVYNGKYDNISKNQISVSAQSEKAIEAISSNILRLLDKVVIYAASRKEVHGWITDRGANIRDAAGEIHSDMKKRFIRAVVLNYHHLKPTDNLDSIVKHADTISIGKNGNISDGDILNIYFNK